MTTERTSLLDLISQGGWAMWPLGTLSMLMLFLVFHCWQLCRITNICRDDRTDAGASGEASAYQRVRAAKSKAVSAGLTQAVIEQRVQEALLTEETKVGQWIQYLNVIATVAPMVGLLGTVSGMISAFQTIAAGGMGKPELLAGDIGEALITTATGLVIGIPAMVAYFVCRNRLSNAMTALQAQLDNEWVNCTEANTAPSSSVSRTHVQVACP
ncbi:MAG: MotA/TolQ/ExbB proton channel family protein [Verrucomicrobia bacterium]|nr:MotA/TolQ/ExbB proton channel family protein [Verrucomicrobiota bacterium]